MNLAISTNGARSTVLDESNGRLVGYIHQGVDSVSVTLPAAAGPVFLAVATYADAVDMLNRLTNLPAGEECSCGDVRARQALISVDVREGAGTIVVSIGTYPSPDAPYATLLLELDERELRTFATALNFAVARLAVTA